MYQVVGCDRDGDALLVSVEGTEPGETADVGRCRAAAVDYARRFIAAPMLCGHESKIAGAEPGLDGRVKLAAGVPVRLLQVFKIAARA